MKKILIAFILIFFFFPVAFAGRVWDSEDITSADNIKSEYTEALSQYRNSRQEYLRILNKNKSENCKSKDSSCENEKKELAEKSTKYISDSRVVMEKYTYLFRVRVENSVCSENRDKMLSDLGEWINWLDEKKEAYSSLMIEEEIENATKELGNFWREREMKLHKYKGSVAICKYSAVTEKIDDIFTKTKSYITSSEMESANDSYVALEKKYQEAKKAIIEADDISKKLSLSSIAKYSDAESRLAEARILISEVHIGLKSLVKELDENKSTSQKNLNIGEISVRGEGVLSVNGNVSIFGEIGNESYLGTLIVDNKENISNIELSKGYGEKETGNKIEYSEVEGLSISGSGLVLEITSDFIDLIIKGEGSVSIKGEALYKTGEEYWTSVPEGGLEINL